MRSDPKQIVRLCDICDIQIGRTPARDTPEFWGPGYPWLAISDMNGGREVVSTKETITQVGVDRCNCRAVEKGTLLLSFKLSIGKVAFAGTSLFTNEAIASLKITRPDLVEPNFLYWAIRTTSFERYVDKAAKGKTLNKAKLRQIEVCLPRLAEQRRIAQVLEKADALRAKRRQVIAKLERVMHFENDPAILPGWQGSLIPVT